MEPTLPTPTLRTATAADDQAVADLAAAAFAVRRTAVGPDHADSWVPRERQVLACVGDRVVGASASWSFGQWFGGRRLECAGIAGVAVAADSRRGGLGGRMVTRLMAAERGRGAVLSALHPAVTGFYRGLGYEIAGVAGTDRFDLVALANALGRGPRPTGGDADITMRPTRAGDLPAVGDLIAARARRGAGLIDHEPRFDLRLLATAPTAYSYVAVRAGQIAGLVCFEHEPAREQRELFGLTLVELVGADVTVEDELWRLLTRHHPGSRTVAAPLALTEYPRALMDPEIIRTEHLIWMLRLLDVRAALTGRGWPAGVRGRVVLDVTDPLVGEPALADSAGHGFADSAGHGFADSAGHGFADSAGHGFADSAGHGFAENDGPITLTVADGNATVEPAPASTTGAGGPADTAVISIDVAALAAVYSGYSDPAEAAYRGRLRCAEDGPVALLRTLFAGPAPMLVDHF